MTELTVPRKRRRWIGLTIALVAVVLLVIAFVVADSAARSYAQGYVRERVVSALKLDPSTKVEVDLGAGSVLLQAAAGSINDVTVSVDTFTVGQVTGAARLTATDVPLDSSKPVNKLGIVVTVDEANVRTLSSSLSGVDTGSVTLAGGVIRLATTIPVSVVTVPVAIDLKPAATAGGVSFEPVTVRVGSQRISVADLRANPEFGPLAAELLSSREFCVASSLPKALTLTKVSVVGSSLELRVNGDGAALGGPGLSERGTCPAA